MNAITSVANMPLSIERFRVDERSSEEICRHRAELVAMFGGPASNVLLDPRSECFEEAGIRGAIAFRRFGRCAVALGDPVSPSADAIELSEAFRSYCADNGWYSIHAVIGSDMAAHFRRLNLGLIEFGVEQILRLEPTGGSSYIRDLRKKLKRARQAGVDIVEYRPGYQPDAASEAAMTNLAKDWLANRRGPQTYWATIDLFRARGITRWFCGMVGGKLVGVLSLLELRNREGYLIEHILWHPDAPVGTSELLITRATEALAAEGCHSASFGPAPAHELGEVSGFSSSTQTLAHWIYRHCCRIFTLDSKVLYRQKFRPSATEPLYLAFDPPRLRLDTLQALGRVFNFSMA